jgi:hypothetical protein
MIDEHRTLEELDGENWGEPETAPTPMVARFLRTNQYGKIIGDCESFLATNRDHRETLKGWPGQGHSRRIDARAR